MNKILFIILLLFMILVFNNFHDGKYSSDKCFNGNINICDAIKKASKKVNKTLPKKQLYTTFYKTSTNDNVGIYYYKKDLTSVDIKNNFGLSLKEYKEKLKQSTRSNICADSIVKKLLDQGVINRYIYTLKDKHTISFDISSSDCNYSSKSNNDYLYLKRIDSNPTNMGYCSETIRLYVNWSPDREIRNFDLSLDLIDDHDNKISTEEFKIQKLGGSHSEESKDINVEYLCDKKLNKIIIKRAIGYINSAEVDFVKEGIIKSKKIKPIKLIVNNKNLDLRF